MLTRRQTLLSWVLVLAALILWASGAAFIAKYAGVEDGSSSVTLVLVVGWAMLAVLLVLSFSILVSLGLWMFTAARADDALRTGGNLFYYLAWKEVRDYLDRLPTKG
jgi:drug/metabolite transporter (DMT)-like permease